MFASLRGGEGRKEGVRRRKKRKEDYEEEMEEEKENKERVALCSSGLQFP